MWYRLGNRPREQFRWGSGATFKNLSIRTETNISKQN